MKIGSHNIQPICTYLIDEPKWIQRKQDAEVYFASQGITDIMWVLGIHAEKAGIEASRPYLRDVPDGNWRIPPRTVGCNISAYINFSVMLHNPNVDYWLFLECDSRFFENWEEILEGALEDAPSDFDYIIAGSCCCAGRETTHIKGLVYEVKYPLCGHVSIIAKKAIPAYLETHRDFCSPGDVINFDVMFPKLKVYTILPRLAEQVDTELPL